MLRVGEDYQLYEDRDTNHHYEDIYNYIVDGYAIDLNHLFNERECFSNLKVSRKV